MLKFISLSFLLLSSTFLLKAQVSVHGRVAGTDGKAIGFANVLLYNEADSIPIKTTQTDSLGSFELKQLTVRRYLLKVSLVGYLAYNGDIATDHKGNIIDLGDITLVTDPKQLQEVVIMGERNAVRYEPLKTILQISGNSAYRSSANVMDILRKAPGLTVNPDGTLLVSGRNPPAIFINGKPVPMSPEEALAYLNGLTPEMVASIEVIANPSSKYDAQYKAIIDIKLKTDQTAGWLGNLSSALRQNIYSSADNNLNLSYRANRVTWFLRGGYVLGDDYYQYTALQKLANTNYMATRTQTRTANNNFNLQIGTEFRINKDQGIEFSIKTYQANRNLDAFNTLTFSEPIRRDILGIRQTTNISDPNQRNYSLNAAYDLRFSPNSGLNIFGSVSDIRNRQAEDIQISNQQTNMLDSYWKTGLKNDISIRNIQADYTLTRKKATFEAGSKFVHVTTNNDIRYDTLSAGNGFVPDAGRTNRFIYDEYVSAAYLTYSYKTQQFDVRASLRAEHTRTLANSVLQGNLLERSYLTWLPAASVSYMISTGQSLTLAFTRRMTRPNFDQLNPFRFYLSPLNYRVGNPNLRPSVTSSFNLAYNRGNFNISMSAGREKDFMTRYPEYNRVTNELLYLGANLPYNDFADIEGGYNFSIFRWWKMSHNIGIYYSKQQMPYLGQTYAIGIIDYSINGSQVFTLPKGFTADMTYRYLSKSGNSLYIRKPMGSIDLGLQKNWLNGKLSSKLNAYDLFYTHAYSLIFREKAIIDNQLTHRFATRRVVLALAYKFGSASYKTSQSRNNEEEKRAGN